MKTPEEMAEEWANQEVPQYHHIDCTPMDRYAHKKAERGFLAGYKAAKEEEATKDQKIAELWTESIKNMLPSVHEITLFPSKLKEEK